MKWNEAGNRISTDRKINLWTEKWMDGWMNRSTDSGNRQIEVRERERIRTQAQTQNFILQEL